jgi:hypothetical protein
MSGRGDGSIERRDGHAAREEPDEANSRLGHRWGKFQLRSEGGRELKL